VYILPVYLILFQATDLGKEDLKGMKTSKYCSSEVLLIWFSGKFCKNTYYSEDSGNCVRRLSPG